LNSFGKVLILKSHNKQQKRIDMGEFYFWTPDVSSYIFCITCWYSRSNFDLGWNFSRPGSRPSSPSFASSWILPCCWVHPLSVELPSAAASWSALIIEMCSAGPVMLLALRYCVPKSCVLTMRLRPEVFDTRVTPLSLRDVEKLSARPRRTRISSMIVVEISRWTWGSNCLR
jgi:hypothetical protein